ncbi:MAG: hypothetical protein LBE92_11605 [Chryseobacterium sp.]|nr:hypothetical protein [Chryseobacterium sp.]MDR2236759.1 hypothetical protein [Chryseobacterium sp.]
MKNVDVYVYDLQYLHLPSSIIKPLTLKTTVIGDIFIRLLSLPFVKIKR